MNEMRVSIVINTYNRAAQLDDCLWSLRHLNHRNFEVVVVNGPSTDDTRSVCARYAGQIKYLDCPDRNLSVSRNIGIAHATGDIVAFIDDDAVPHPDWLTRLVAAYADPAVVGAGGYTINHAGRDFQVTATLCDRMGNAHGSVNSPSAAAFGFPGSPLFPSLLGTNSSFRRAALAAIGGFDETYAYFLDETDVCLRLSDAGGHIVYVADALVYHRYAASHLRNTKRVSTSLFVQARSKAYFIYRHGAPAMGEDAAAQEIQRYQRGLARDSAWQSAHGYVSGSARLLLDQDTRRGIDEGRELARRPAPVQLAERIAAAGPQPFKPFAGAGTGEPPLRLVMVSQGWPPGDTSGIARWTHEVATGLARRGHQVHVVTRADQQESSDYQAGLWVHRIAAGAAGPDPLAPIADAMELPSGLSSWSSAVCREILRIGPDNLDIVSAPIWDLEGIVSLAVLDLPVVTSLHTTYALARPYKPDWQRPLYDWNHVRRVIAGERALFARAPYFLGNSRSIVAEIAAAYGTDIAGRTIIVPHGADPAPALAAAKTTGTGDRRFNVLFVGRQECRKGFDTALRAALALCRQRTDIAFRFLGAPISDPVCSQVLAEVTAAAVQAGCGDRLRVEGHVGDDVLLAAYAACDVFLAPSRYESFGLVAIEAMRFGKPVIAGKAGGLAEVVGHMSNGLLVDPDQAEEVAAAIRLLQADAPLRQRLGEQARRDFDDKYTTDAMVQGIENAYRTILSTARARDAR